MIYKSKLFLVNVVPLFSTILTAQLPIQTQLIPQLPELTTWDKEPKQNLTQPTSLITLPKLPINPISGDTHLKLDDILSKVKNGTGKIKLEDFPENTDMDELLKEIIYKGLIEYEEHHTTHPLLEWAVEQLKIPSKIFSNNPITTSIININVCNACAAVFKYMVIRSRAEIKPDRLIDVLVFICKLFRISSERVCRGAIELNIYTIIYIIQEKKSLTELNICATIFQTFSCFKQARSKWEVFIPNQDTPPTTVEKKSTSDKTFRILHITDFHLDPLYEQGASTDCGEPLCCQNDQGSATSPKNAAGKWGDYRECDMPYYSFTNYLEQITQQIKEKGQEIDFVYFTGDVISHRVWNTSREGNTEQLQKTYKMLGEYFGSIPVYSVIGNHEPHPLNIFSPPSITNHFSNRWIYNVMGGVWSKWLPSSTNETVLYGGYYTFVVKPGFRLIALNSNVCYTFNWWLLYDDIDPFHQLRWLSVTLKQAESQNEFVHILSHVPPGDNTCIQEWTRQFRRIIERYAHIVKAQFNGHTHWDELRVFYNSSNPDQVINLAFNGGSFTTFSDLNPNYRYYTIDSETFDVLDYEQWIYNLDEANAEPNKPPKWYKQYSFKDAYGLESLKYKEIEKLIDKMASNSALLEQYYRFKVRSATPSLLAGCKGSCQKENLCSIVTTEVDDDSKCKTLTGHKHLLPF